jgi:hypothetical protein
VDRIEVAAVNTLMIAAVPQNAGNYQLRNWSLLKMGTAAGT